MRRSRRSLRTLRPKRAPDMEEQFARQEPFVKVANGPVRVARTTDVLSGDVPKGKGPVRFIDDDWRRAVLARLKDELHILPIDLARMVSCSKSHMSDLLSFKKQKNSSPYVDAIHYALRWPAPTSGVVRPPHHAEDRSAAPHAEPRTEAMPTPPGLELVPPSSSDAGGPTVLSSASRGGLPVPMTLPAPEWNAQQVRGLMHAVVDMVSDDVLRAWLNHVFPRPR